MSSQGALPDGLADFGLIETLLWTREGGYFLRAGHRARLVNSARALGFAFAQKDFDEVLARACEGEAAAARRRPQVREVIAVRSHGRRSRSWCGLTPRGGGVSCFPATST